MQVTKILYQNNSWSEPIPPLDSEQTLVIVFAAPGYIKNSDPLKELRSSLPTSTIIGCSTAGEIYGDQVLDNSLSVAIIKFDDARIKFCKFEIPHADDSRKAGENIGQTLAAEDLKGILVLSNGLFVNGTPLVEGINSQIREDVVVTGGLAGDGSDFESTWIISGDELLDKTVAAVGLYGNSVQLSHGTQGGWDIFGPERVITRSVNNIVYEIDGEPALDLYKKYLGESAKDLPSSALLFPLQIRSNQDGRPLVRTILSVCEEEKSMTFAGDIPQGSLGQLVQANFDRLVDGAVSAATQANLEGDEVLAIAISCIGRRLVLGERIEEETEATLENLPKGVEQIGFYSYGELSPGRKGAPCELHNQTMTITTISENRKAG